MKPKTEEFLNILLWTAESLSRPTFRNLTESYESWAYREGLIRQSTALTRQGMLESEIRAGGDRLYRLTAKGRLHVLGGRVPPVQWVRPWDGKWRMVLYDVPRDNNSHRNRLRRHLLARHFGCLQGSVWVTPDPMHEEKQAMVDGDINVNSLLLLEARPCAGESDCEVVEGAWNFLEINEAYTNHMEALTLYEDKRLSTPTDAKRLQRWATKEKNAWLAAVTIDPLLPDALLPPGYLGKIAWEQRMTVMKSAAQRMREFEP